MGLLTDAGLDSGAYRNRLLSSTNGLAYWDESVGRREFSWDTVNSRWQLVYGDTGWRDISSLAVNGWSGTLYLRRIGALVIVNVLDLNGEATATADTVFTIPTGYRDISGNAFSGLFFGSTAGYAYGSGTFGVLRSAVSGIGEGRCVWDTTDAWPATLPGTAVGSIPFA
jgi:hypothetical protein